MSLLNGNWQSQNVLFIRIMQFFGPFASIYCPGAARIRPNATIFRSSASIFSSDYLNILSGRGDFCPTADVFYSTAAIFDPLSSDI